MQATIVIVTYNRLDRTILCLESLFDTDLSNVFIHCVDNNSTDGSGEFLADLLRKKKIHKLYLLNKNYGVSPASNLGWSNICTPFYIKLDNDMFVKKKDWVDRFLKVYSSIPKVAQLNYFYNHEYKRDDIRGPYEINGVTFFLAGGNSGGCVLIGDEAHRKYGFWCEDYGLYGEEDADYSIRVRKGGNVCAYMPDKGCLHHEGFAESDHEYTKWKKDLREKNLMLASKFQLNQLCYEKGLRPLYMKRKFDFIQHDELHWSGYKNFSYDDIDQLHRKLKTLVYTSFEKDYLDDK